MVRWVGKQLVLLAVHAVVIIITIAFALKIWPDIKDKPPLEVLMAAAAGTVAARYFFFLFGLDRFLMAWLPGSRSQKTDPVIGPAPAPAHTYEEWKADLDKVDGQDNLDDFLAKWADVPPSMRPKKFVERQGPKGPDAGCGLQGPPVSLGQTGNIGPSGASGEMNKGPGEGREIPNRSGIPDHVVGWIDKHYERASQLWQRAHPGQDLPHPNPRK